MTTPRLVYAVDLDSTLSIGNWWGEPEQPAPRPARIERVNELYKAGHVIIIYTARTESMRHDTIWWLRTYGVKYHALVCDKLHADHFIDDRNECPESFFKDGECICADQSL